MGGDAFGNRLAFVGGMSSENTQGVRLCEKTVLEDSAWAGKRICELDTSDELIIFIKRQGRAVIPNGNTLLKAGDVLVLTDAQKN